MKTDRPTAPLNGSDPVGRHTHSRGAAPLPPAAAKGAILRLALTKAEAAEALGVSVDFFEHHVMHELRIVRRGRRRLIPLAELTRWLEASAERTLGS